MSQDWAGAYADAGRVWDSRAPNDLADTWLTNVGVGLRVIPTRAEKGKVLHVDLRSRSIIKIILMWIALK